MRFRDTEQWTPQGQMGHPIYNRVTVTRNTTKACQTLDTPTVHRQHIVIPFLPSRVNPKYTNSDWKDANSEQMQHNQALLKRPSVQKLFMGYYHDESMQS